MAASKYYKSKYYFVSREKEQQSDEKMKFILWIHFEQRWNG